MARPAWGSEDQVVGEVEPGYGAVADAFRRLFADRREVGAALAVYREGRPVADLRGGFRDGLRRLPWERDTLVPVFSTTRGMASIALAVAHSRGSLDFEARVAGYWPEFAQHGKGAITVWELMSHRAGLAALDRPVELDVLTEANRLADQLARQAPLWEPGKRQGYAPHPC